MSQIPNLSFDVRFEPHNPNRVGLIDTTPSLPDGYIGIFKVTQPDGYVRSGDINNPDVNNVTRSVSVTIMPDAAGQIQQGQYTIELTALAPGYLSTVFTRTFTFQYNPASVVLRNDFDLFTPSLAYTDISNYNVSGYNISSGPERKWDVTSPTTGLISGTNSSIDLVYNGNYYAENYSIAFRVNIAYASQAYAWLSITHTINATAAVTACIPKSIEELTQAVDALRIESNQACGDDWSRFEKANALYTHLINMLRLVLVAGEYQEGFYDVYQQLLSLLQNGNTTCSTIGQIIPPYDFSDYESSIYDGEASYCTLVGNGVDTVYTINHQLGDKCVVAQVYEVATGKQVICDLAVVTINTIDLTFFEPPTTNQYRVVVVAGAIGIRGQGLQPGGLDGQVLVKKSDADFDTEWADASFVNPLLVPYVNALFNVNLGEFGLTGGYLGLDTTPTGTPALPGTIAWNDSDGTADLRLKGGNVMLQIGQEMVARVVNKTGANLLESQYRAVRIRKVSEGGAQGQRLAVVLAQANNELGSTDMIGIVTESISDNQEGFITTFGTVRGIDTTGTLQGEVWADGDILFLSPTVPGGLTKVKPSAPNHLVIMGYVEYAHQNNGKIFVHVQTSWELEELHNVKIATPATGQTLVYNSVNGLWENRELSLNELSDVAVSAPATGQVLTYNGAGWNNAALPASVTSVGLASTTPGITITNTPVTGSGVININIATASGSTNGLLSSADWTVFNGKQAFITPGTTGQYYRGDKTFQNLDTSVVPESTNLYFTDSRARQAISLTTIGSSGAATYDNSTGIINVPQYTLGSLGGVPSTRTLTINGTAYDLSADRSWSVGTVTSVNMSVPTGFAIGGNPVTSSGTLALSFAAGYSLPTDASQANWNTAYTNRITSLTTTGTSGAATLVSNVLNIPQYQAQGNYITSLTGEATASGPGAASVTLSNSAVTGKVLTGLTVTGTTIAATDSILTAFGKVQGQINSLMGGLKYQGTWNASTNTPTLASATGTEGYFYIVSVAGTTSIDGINDWKVGDWIVYNGGAWQKVDNTDSVVSVNGATGAVVLTTTNISEGTNLYYTNARARLALSLTTTGSSGAATYDNITGVFNIPQYTLAGLGGVPTTRQLTINGTAFDLSADRSWSVGTVTSVAALTIGSSGTDVNSSVSNGTTTPVITLNIPSASTTARGLVTTSAQTFGGEKTFYSNATILDTAGASSQLQGRAGGTLYGGIFFGPFYQFNAYAAATEGYVWKNAATDNVMTLTQTGAFSLKTLVGTGTRMVVTDANGLVSTQAIPSGTTTGSGTTNYISKWTSSTGLGNSIIYDDATNVGIGTASPAARLHISGAELRIQNDNSLVGFRNAAGTRTGYIQSRADAFEVWNDQSTPMVFGASNAERLRITASGSLYFKGASTTANAEAIIENDNTSINLYASASGSVNKELRLYFNATSSGERIRIFNNGRVFVGPTPTDAGYQLDVAGTLRSTLGANFATTSGNVGIGTTSPGSKLEIVGATTNSGPFNDGVIQIVGLNPIAFVGQSNLNPALNRWGFKLREVADGDFSIYDYRNSVNRLLINASGNVGIGTTSPQQQTHINASTGGYIQLSRTAQGGTTSPFGGIYFGDGTTFQEAAILSYADGNVVSGSLEFYTRAAAGALTQRMKIASTGSITMSSLAGTGTRMVVADATGTLSTQSITGGVVLGSGTLNYVAKWTPDGATLGNSQIFDNGTNVGIGTALFADTSAKLDVASSVDIRARIRTSQTTSYLYFQNASSGTTNGDGFTVGLLNSDALLVNREAGIMAFYTSEIERLRIFANGRVGINTGATDAGFQFDVNGSTRSQGVLFVSGGSLVSQAGLQIFYNSTTGTSTIDSHHPGVGYKNLVIDGETLTLQTRQVNHVTITSGGAVGIGTTSPSARLEVVDSNAVSDIGFRVRQAANGTAAYMNIVANTDGGAMYNFINSSTNGGTEHWRIWGGAAASTLAFNTAGVERMRISSTGNVGIGVTPSAWIGTWKAMQINSASLASRSDGLGTILGNNWFINTSGSDRYINSDFASIYYQTSGEHRWYTAPSGTAGNAISFTQAMTLTSAGNLGLGTTSPLNYAVADTYLEVSAKSAGGAGVYYASNNGKTIISHFYSDSLVGGVGTQTNHPLIITTNNLERIRVTSVGNVGIGTTSPVNELEVFGNNQPRFSIRAVESISESLEIGFQFGSGVNSSTNTLGLIRAIPTQVDPNPLIADLAFSTNSGDSNTEKMRITGDGNVGIGTTSPYTVSNYKFITLDGVTGAGIQFRFGGSAVGEISATGSATVLQAVGARPIVFYTNTVDRARITAGGNLLVATSSDAGPRATIHASGAGSPATSGTSQVGPLRLSNGYNAMVLDFGFDTSSNAWIQAANGQALGTSTNLLINPNGGNVGIGTTSPGARLHVVSNNTTAYVSTNTLTSGTTAYIANNGVTNSIAATLRLDAMGADSSLAAATISSVWTGSASSALTFGTRLSGGSVTERMRIDASGNVGIGTTSPGSATLRVQGIGSDAVQSALQLSYNTSMTSGVNGVYMSFNNSSEPNSQLARIAAFYEGGTYRGSLRFYTNTVSDGGNPTEKMRIFHTGNMFVGPTPVDSGYRLDVDGTLSVRNGKIDVLANTDFAMSLNRSGTSPVAYQAFNTSSWIIMGAESSSGGNIFTGSSANAAVVGSGYNTPLQFATNNTVRMTVDNAGNVGVGTIPSAWSSITPAIQIKNASLYGFSTTELGLNQNAFYDGAWKYISNGFATQYVQAGGNHQWLSAASGTAGGSISWTERMRITSSGEVLVGTTTDIGDYKLQVNGGIYTNYQMKVAAAQLSIEGHSNAAALYIASHSVTGSSTQPVIQADVTLNTTGDVNLLNYSITNTASGANTNWLRMSDGTNTFRVTKNAAVVTAAPTGGSAKPWKLGAVVATTVTLNTGNFVEVEIDGTFYRLAIVNPA